MSNARIEVTYLTQTTNQTQTQEEDDRSLAFRLLDKREFHRWARTQGYRQEPYHFWDILIGNYPHHPTAKPNPNALYLTEQAAEKLMAFSDLFQYSGIDFEHLPAGFFLCKNPHDGIRNVLHYSHLLAQRHTSHPNPFTLILSPKNADLLLETTSDDFLNPAQQAWFERLKAQMDGQCTEKELRDAFIAFSNMIESAGLSFYMPPAPNPLGSPKFNPIILLCRWKTVLFNRHLKKTDRPIQWSCLWDLPLEKSYQGIRAITDYQMTAKPCGFLLPEMHTEEYHVDPSPASIALIQTEEEFWSYLSYQPKRNSIDFYRQALQAIEALASDTSSPQKLTPDEAIRLRQILVDSTTGDNCTGHDEAKEALDLQTWHELCKLIQTITEASTYFRLLDKDYKLNLQRNFIQHLCRLIKIPNLPFYQSIALHIRGFISGLRIIDMAKEEPLSALLTLSNQLNFLIETYRSNFYAGARFYFQDGNWQVLNVQTYTQLQDYYDLQPCPKLILPYLSHFNLHTREDIDALTTLFNNWAPGSTAHRHLVFALDVFKALQRPSSLAKLQELIQFCKTADPFVEALDSVLDFIELHFEGDFDPAYIQRRKDQLRDAQHGLNEQQKRMVYNCRFLDEDTNAIIQIESALLRQAPRTNDAQLSALNEQFLRLSELFSSDDFSQWLKQLATMREQMPVDSDELRAFLDALIQLRSLEAFNQIYYCQKIQRCADLQLIEKFRWFIQTIRPLSLKEGLVLNTVLLQEALANIVLNSTAADLHDANYLTHMEALVTEMNTLALQHPHVQTHIFQAYQHMPNKGNRAYFTFIRAFNRVLKDIHQLLPATHDELGQENMFVFYSLLAHFHKNPMDLIQLWGKIQPLAHDTKRHLLKLIGQKLSGNQSIESVDSLVEKLVDNPAHAAIFIEHCGSPPYPDFPSLAQWIDDDFVEKYAQFSKQPFGPRHLEYAFSVVKCEQQLQAFQALNPELHWDENLALHLDTQLITYRQQSVPELQTQLTQLRAAPISTEEQRVQLLCLCAEILARTAHQTHPQETSQRISQELNTTQILSLYLLLKQGNRPDAKLISEIDTGEGKSRIMMMLAAFQALQGKTVDFLTSDLQLAERDYLNYKNFFSALDVRTSLIRLETPKQLYQKGGINFSDNGQLLLLRNRSDIELDSYAYLDEDASRRCLLVDEVDRFKHDRSTDAYNFATKSRLLTRFTWIYPLLIDFMTSYTQRPHFQADEPCVRAFMAYILTHVSNDEQLADFNTLKDHYGQQINTWLNAAYTAHHMRVNKDYVLTKAGDTELIAVRDHEGNIRYSRQIYVLDKGRPMEGCSFSDGVHQCLTALENKRAGREEFIISPENEMQRSSFPVSFMANYASIFGVSGTTRSEAPRASKNINYEDYQYLRVPREKPLRRVDRKTWLAKDEEQQFEFIKRSVLKQLQLDKPVLIICKDDNQSHRLYQALQASSELTGLISGLQQVHGLSSAKEEKTAIAEAGQGRRVTISTAGMFSRGVDIDADDLLVLAAYVPPSVDDIQIKGRTGRIGKSGSYRQIINASDADATLDKPSYNIAQQVETLQKQMDLSATFEQEICKLYALFLEEIHQRFLSSFRTCRPEDRLSLLEHWDSYLSAIQKAWLLEKIPLLQAVKEQQQQSFYSQWQAFTQTWLERHHQQVLGNAAAAFDSGKEEVIYNSLQSHVGFFKPQKKALARQRAYDVADDGQANIYTSLFAQTRATFTGERRFFANYHAWREHRGVLFADFKALLAGDRALFANLRACIADLRQGLDAPRVRATVSI
jgi:superfamily II DNA or RNA helicase